MATPVSIPIVLHTALRSVEYVFDMPSVGVSPELKYLRYRLKNQTDNIYLTDWKYYRPVADGQDIKIDFYKDLFEIVSTPPPPFAFPNAMITNTDIIKKIAVEYGERTVNTETCDPPVDTLDGTTNSIDVINGIGRVWSIQIPETGNGYVLSKRPKQYTLNQGAYDWVYVIGSMTINVSYYSSTGLIATIPFVTTGSHPGSPVFIIPCGFQYPNLSTTNIIVSSPQYVTAQNPDGIIFQSEMQQCSCENGEVRDLYLQNNEGGVDIISFDCVDTKQMNVAKQAITKKYNEADVNKRTTGQRRTINNTSSPVITLKKQYDLLTYPESKWLDEMAASGNVWMRETLDVSGTDVLIRMNVVDGSFPTYGEDVELILQLTYSEEFIYPY
jgi:hypothetical protein